MSEKLLDGKVMRTEHAVLVALDDIRENGPEKT
jgi:hypothetical protein